jgi:hypothetical protein
MSNQLPKRDFNPEADEVTPEQLVVLYKIAIADTTIRLCDRFLHIMQMLKDAGFPLQKEALKT